MLSFFKINVPDRIIVLFLLLLAIRLPLFITGTPLFAPELYWLLVGEKLSKGYVMYRDVWDNTAPLAAFMYMLLNYIAGKSSLALQLVSFLFVFWQALIFNRMGIKQELYLERTFIPALVYIIGISLFYDFLTLSPILMGLSFLLLATDKIFKHIRYGVREDEIFLIGFYIGLASLCKLPLVIFLFFPMICFVLYTGTTPRLYALIVLGFFLTFAAAFLLFFGFGAGADFYYNFIGTLFASYRSFFVGWGELLPIVSVPLVLAILSVFKVLGSNRFINYQSVVQACMGFWVIFSMLTIWLDTNRSPYSYLVFWPAVAFFGTHFFMLIRKKWQAELLFSIWVMATLFMLYVPAYGWLSVDKWLPLNSFEISSNLPKQANQDKRIVVLGKAPAYYVGNTLATPYLNYALSVRDLHDLGHYSSVLRVYNNFTKELPEIIIKAPQDPSLDSLFARMPVLAQQYRVSATDTNVYEHINSSPMK